MASRREQKEQLRREREQREAAVKAGQRRRQMIGYAVGGAVVLIAAVIAIAVLAGGDGGGNASADVLPDGGSYKEPNDEVESLAAAAKIGNCELKSFKATSREHVADPTLKIKYASKPPTSGSHFQVPAEDKAYEDAPDVKEIVHTLEHGRVIIWFRKNLPAQQRASLKAYYDDDPYQIVLTPDETGMPYQVAVTAWSKDPEPNGTGRLLGCKRYSDDIFTAIEAFKDEHRSRGPEPVP